MYRLDSTGLLSEIMHGGSLVDTLPNVNYDEIKVTQSGIELIEDTDYTYVNSILSIPIVEGNIKITNTGIFY